MENRWTTEIRSTLVPEAGTLTERALAQARGLGVGGDVGIEEVVPHADDFRLGLAFLEAQAGEDFRDDCGSRFRVVRARGLEGDEVDVPPLGEGLPTRGVPNFGGVRHRCQTSVCSVSTSTPWPARS